MSVVHHQPETKQQREFAIQALLSCPTASIGTVGKPTDVKQIQQTFPIPIAENVYHCGYHSPRSYGAGSYLIQRPEGNILIDSPRFAPPLVKQLEAMGGVDYMFLSHRDDIADHQKFHDHFGCDRILHRDEIGASTQDVEIKLDRTEPIALQQLGQDTLIIPVPGHTKGHLVLLYKNKFLFTGDHLAWSGRLQQLVAFRNYCWYSWPETLKSMEKLATYDFEWVLPGHGRRYHADKATMKEAMQTCLNWMRSQ